MPKTKSVPSYKLHKPSGQARVIIAGRHHYLGAYGTPESHERYARLLAEHASGTGSLPPATTADAGAVIPLKVKELAAAYWLHAEAYYVKNGRKTGHLYVVKQGLRALKELYATTPAVDLGPLKLKAIQQSLVAKGHARSYVNACCSVIKRMCKWAASEEIIPAMIYHGLATVPGLKRGRTQAREPDPIGPVDEAIVEATLPHLSPLVADMIRLHRLLGCRPSEVCVIRPRDVDRSGPIWVYVPGEHKTEHHGRQRRILVGPKAQTILTPYLLRDADAYCFSPVDGAARRKADRRAARQSKVQPSQRDRSKRKPRRTPGGRYTEQSYYLAIRRACAARAGLKRPRRPQDPKLLPAYEVALGEFNRALAAFAWHPNQLRHAAATQIRAEHGLEAAQIILGHSRADVTQVYAERDMSKAIEVVRKIG